MISNLKFDLQVTRQKSNMRMEIVGISLGVIGFLTALVTCALPLWRKHTYLSCYFGFPFFWEGLWMICDPKSTGQLQCRVYNSPQVQAFRAIMIIAIILAALGILISIVGIKCTKCIKDGRSKAKVMITTGIFFILSGLLVLIPVSWTASRITRGDPNDIMWYTMSSEMGASVYTGWASAALLLIGGAVLCSRCLAKEKYQQLTKPSADSEAAEMNAFEQPGSN